MAAAARTLPILFWTADILEHSLSEPARGTVEDDGAAGRNGGPFVPAVKTDSRAGKMRAIFYSGLLEIDYLPHFVQCSPV